MKLIGALLWNFAIAIDQLLNTILLGHPDETVSSRLGRSVGKERYLWVKYLRISIDYLFWWDYSIDENGKKIGHCESSVIPLENSIRSIFQYELWSWQIDSKER